MSKRFINKAKELAIKTLAKHGHRITVIGGTVIDGTKSLGFDVATRGVPSHHRDVVTGLIANNLINLYNDWVVAIIVCHKDENGVVDLEVEELLLRKVKASEIDSNLSTHLDDLYLDADEQTRVSKLWVASPSIKDCLTTNINKLESFFIREGCYDREIVKRKIEEFKLKEESKNEN